MPLEGRVIEPQRKKDRVPKDAPRPASQKPKTDDELILLIQNFIRSYIHGAKHEDFPKYAQAIFTAFYDIILNKGTRLMEECEEGKFIRSNLNAISLNPIANIPTIKYNILYLEAVYEDIVKFVKENKDRKFESRIQTPYEDTGTVRPDA